MTKNSVRLPGWLSAYTLQSPSPMVFIVPCRCQGPSVGQHSRLAAEGLKQCDSHRPFNLEVREGARGLCCHHVEMVRQQQMVSSEWSLHQDSQVSDLGSATDQGRTHSHFLRLLQQTTRDLAA